MATRDGSVKLSAAWLIENSGVSKGFAIGGAAISSLHVLALTNAKDGTAADLIQLAQHVIASVKKTFGITLETRGQTRRSYSLKTT
jgi:UDP-N-acetylmuramate dehydrogenase